MMSIRCPLRFSLAALLLALLSPGGEIVAQTHPQAARAALWDGYALPAEEFVRHVDRQKGFWFTRPASWTQTIDREGDLIFSASPSGPTISVMTEEIPDGYGVANYTTSVLQQFRPHRVRTETMIVRRVPLSGIEARELTFELEPAGGEVVRDTFWLAAIGARAFIIVLNVQPSEQERYEPYLKRLILSFGIGAAGYWNEEFEALRARVSAAPSAAQIEALELAERVRAAASPRAQLLSEAQRIAASFPSALIDLLVHHHPQVRALAIEVLAAVAEGSALPINDALIWALRDPDLYCSTLAARALAQRAPDSLASVRASLPLLSARSEAVVRLGAALDPAAAGSLAVELLQSARPSEQLSGLALALALPLDDVEIPAARLILTKDDRVRAALVEALRVRRPKGAAQALLALEAKGETELWVARAMGEIGETDLAARFEKRIAEIDRQLGVVVVRTNQKTPPRRSNARAGRGAKGGPPPPMPQPATTTEAMTMPVLSSAGSLLEWGKLTPATRLALLRGALHDAALKIRLRDRWQRAASAAERRAIRREIDEQHDSLGLWAAAALREPEAAASLKAPANMTAPSDGRTLLPAETTLYLQAPDFARTLSALDQALAGVQMATVRDQMNLALILQTAKARLSSALEVEGVADLSAALGIDLGAPIAMGAWPGDGSQTGRGAVLLRVNDQARFERLLASAAPQIGDLPSMIAISSAVARFAGLAPAIAPIIFAVAAAENPRALPLPGNRIQRIAASPELVFLRREQAGEALVTVIEKVAVASGPAPRESIYIAYIGETALVASSRHALADALAAAEGGEALGRTEAFARVAGEKGELIFFSRLGALFEGLIGEAAEKDGKDGEDEKSGDRFLSIFAEALGTESGALQLSPSSWETVFHLRPGRSELLESFRPFAAADLAAPRELLPRGTILYTGAVFDPSRLWSALVALGAEASKSGSSKNGSSKNGSSKNESAEGDSAKDGSAKSNAAKSDAAKSESSRVEVIDKRFDEEIEREVIPAMAGEAAFAIISLRPLLNEEKSDLPSLLGAFKLKDKSLAAAFRDGRLFSTAARIKGETALGSPIAALGSDSPYLAITDDYLIVAESLDTLRRLGKEEKFASTRDYSRSMENLPRALRLFATYDLAAAYAEAQEVIARSESLSHLLPLLSAVTHAFHSQRAYLALDSGRLEGRLAISFDREGRFAVGAVAPGDEFDVANAIIAPKGLKLAHAPRVETIRLRMSARQDGAGARLRDDIGRFEHQRVESSDERSVVFEVRARRIPENLTIQLPVAETEELAPHLRSTPRINASAPQIVALARQIAGDDRDGRSVARKLGDWTYANLKWKRVSSDTLETLASREADCLEHAELYVALARSLGLPARVASGAAFSGGAFGAHAWVEVYLGRWVELDPTWGLSDYVDATHVRFEDDTFASFVMLNQIDLEVIEARNVVAEFQRQPRDLLSALSSGGEEKKEGRELIFDLRLAAAHAFGEGAWEKFDAAQREAVIRAFDRVTAEQLEDWSADAGVRARLLGEDIRGERATLLALRDMDLMKLTLARRDGAWYVVEIEDLDSGIGILGQSLRGAIDPRADRWHILALDPERALKRLDELIAAEGESPELLVLKAMTLARRQFMEMLRSQEPRTEQAREARDEANELYERIISRWPDFAPGHYLLALRLPMAEKYGKRRVALLERYAALVPYDPRPWRELAATFEILNEPARVEAAYREALARDRGDDELRLELVAFNLRQNQMEKATSALKEALLTVKSEEAFELLDELINPDPDDPAEAELLARYEALLLAFPQQIAQSQTGLRSLARVQQSLGKMPEALRSLERAIAIKATAGDYIYLAQLNRQSKRARAALAAADQAVKLEKDEVGGHLERAYALIALGRQTEAVASLKRVLEIAPTLREYLAEDEGLKPLAALPAFKALLAAPAPSGQKP